MIKYNKRFFIILVYYMEEFNKRFDFKNKQYRTFQFITEIDEIKPYLAYVLCKMAKDGDYIICEMNLLGVCKDQNHLDFKPLGKDFYSQTKYNYTGSLDSFNSLIRDDKDVLEDALEGLLYLLNKHKEEVKESLRDIRWEE